MTSEGFLRDIVANSEDDTPRLIFADWLDEHGDPDRAEFIRVQVELDRLHDCSPRRIELLARQHALVVAHVGIWLAALPKLRGVAWLEWSRGFIGTVRISSAQAFRDHAEAVFAAAPLRELQLGGQVTGRTVSQILASPLLARLAILSLNRVRLGDPGIEAVAGCPYLTGLRELRLDLCGITQAGAAALARSPYLTGLRLLHLDSNDLGPEGVRALAGSPLLAGLRTLNLYNAQVGDAGVLELARSPHVGAIRELRLGGNWIGDAGVRALAGSERLASLESLSLISNRIGDEEAAVLATKTGLPALSYLHLGGNEITDTGALALARGPSLGNLKLLSFYCYAGQIGPEGVAALRERFGDRVVFM